MRLLLFLLAGLAYSAGPATPAQAVEYRWCANFADGAGTNCGFLTYEQCMLTARGSGGYCAENTFYKPPTAAPRTRPASRKPRSSKKD